MGSCTRLQNLVLSKNTVFFFCLLVPIRSSKIQFVSSAVPSREKKIPNEFDLYYDAHKSELKISTIILPHRHNIWDRLLRENCCDTSKAEKLIFDFIENSQKKQFLDRLDFFYRSEKNGDIILIT